MSDKAVLLEISNGVATITLNEPKRLNALSTALIQELNAALDKCSEDSDLRAMVLTANGRGFCSGADLSAKGGSSKDGYSRGEATRQNMHNHLNPIVKKILNLPIPTIAAINGVAAGGGYGLALACDLVIAAESAEFILVFTPQLGLIPDIGASWHAPRIMGRAKAMALAFFGDRMKAADAVEAGLIWKAVPDEQLMEETRAIAEKLSVGPTRAYAQVRKTFDLASQNTLHEHLDLEAETQPALIATDDFIEGARAFMQKRKPDFKGS
ncbi:MAG: 2-(1,2-epoxy-1,2-dihydrophenyl)acetyl-CoA isomerase PaaG [Parasphingorhabdus sp.]